MEGFELKRIQIALNQLSTALLAIDERYGDRTTAAVVAFEEAAAAD
jgi:hypothetical protein